MKLNNQQINYLELLKLELINIKGIEHNFNIIERRYKEFDKILSISFPD
jgi:hypothetical protein